MTTNSLFSQLNMGKRAMGAQQSGMSTAGHNISNVNNEDFTRQRVDLDSSHPLRSGFGTGVEVKGVERVTDRFLNERLIGEQSRQAGSQIREETLRRLESTFAEIEGYGIRDAMNEFWGAWGRLANQPEREIYRKDLINAARTLANRIRGLDADFTTIRKDLNGRVAEKIERVNRLAGTIAELNTRIQQAERGHGEANDLRDERTAAIKELSRLAQVDWHENKDNLVIVSVANGFPLVTGREHNTLEASTDHPEPGLYSVKGVDRRDVSRDLTGDLKSGELAEILRLRDETVVHFQERLDTLASELAYRVNRLHNGGTGLNAQYEKLQSAFALQPDAVNRPLPFLEDGLFRMHLVNAEHEVVESYEVEVQAGQDTVRDIVRRINETVGDSGLLRARLNQDGTVSLNATGKYDLALGKDESGFAALMGFNNFFENLQGAQDFQVNPRLQEHPNLISTGRGMLPGDNSVARDIADLQHDATMQGDSITFDEFYNGTIAELGILVNRAQDERKNAELIADQFQKLRDEVSSVNMDEEVANMVAYQRGFEAAAKFVSNVDEMTETVIRM